MKVQKHILFFIAGILWSFAGLMVTQVGIKALIKYHPVWVFIGAVVIYTIFYTKIFAPLVVKNEKRLLDHPNEKLPWFMFFDKKSYTMMCLMMPFGILLRTSGLIPIWFFSFFYTGLGLALFTCGVRYIFLVIKHNPKRKIS